MTLKTCWCVSTFFLGSAVAPTLLAAEPTPAPDSLLAPGLWCAEYQPEAHSCAVVRLFEARPGGTAHLRQVVVGWDRREGLQKVVLDFQVQLDGAGFCYDAGFTVIDQLQVYRSDDRGPWVTAADTPLPRVEFEFHLAKSGVKPALVGQRICLSMAGADWTLIPPAQATAIVLREL